MEEQLRRRVGEAATRWRRGTTPAMGEGTAPATRGGGGGSSEVCAVSVVVSQSCPENKKGREEPERGREGKRDENW